MELTAETDWQEMIGRLKRSGQVKYVEENKRIRLHRVPNDIYYVQQWGLETIRAEAAWEIAGTATKPVVVAVIDSGIDSTHYDLIDRIDSRGYSFVDDNQDISDNDGHGTAVASIIAAQTDNNLGIAGVDGQAPVKILPLKTVDWDGYSYMSDVIKAINYAIDAGVDVINLSMGSDSYSDIENDAIQMAISHGITVVASAGNEGCSRYDYPASYPGVISVGAIDREKKRAEFSNYNDRVDVVAPGVKITTCVPGDGYDCLTGTSFSAPMVTGIAAMLKSLDPTLNAYAIGKIIRETSCDLGSPGKDNEYGYGVVDMNRAVLQGLPGFITWETHENVAPTRPWSIRFSSLVESSSINQNTIFITDQQGNQLPIKYSIEHEQNADIVCIKPEQDYNFGEHYTLWIRNVVSGDGRTLKNGVKMDFTITESWNKEVPGN